MTKHEYDALMRVKRLLIDVVDEISAIAAVGDPNEYDKDGYEIRVVAYPYVHPMKTFAVIQDPNPGIGDEEKARIIHEVKEILK